MIALALSLAGLYLRYETLAHRELSGDELYQLEDGRMPFSPPWDRSSTNEVTSFKGDYLLTYPFMRIFGNNKWGVMIPHILATALGFYFLYLICRKYFKTAWGYTVTFAVAAFNSNLIFHSFELRPYAVLPTLALTSFYLADKVVTSPHQLNPLQKFLVGLFFVLVVAYHAYGIFIVFFCLTYFILLELGRQPLSQVIFKNAKFCGLLAIFALPAFIWFATGVTDFSIAYFQAQKLDTFQYIPNPLVNLTDFLKAIFGNLVGDKRFYFLLIGILLAFVIPHKERLKQTGFFLVLIVLPIQIKFLVDVFKEYWFIQRQFIWVMPLFAFFLGWCWDAVIRHFTSRRQPQTLP